MVSGKKYLNEKAECMPRDELRNLQLERLQDIFQRAREKCSFYRNYLEEQGVLDFKIKSIEDIQRLPLMSKRQAHEAYPAGLCMVPMHEVTQIHGTTGTTGKPTLTFATRHDIELWAERNARNFFSIGFRPGDIFLKIGGYGLASGAFGFHFGAQRLGCAVVPTGLGQVEQKIDLLEDLKADGMGGSPTFIAYMGEVSVERGLNFREKPYPRIVLFGGQPTARSTREKIMECFGVKAFDEYGMTELLGPGMACECERQEGLHVWSDQIFVECIDPKTGEWVPDGEEGELVWTFLVSQSMAIIRYRSGDLSRIITEPCGCGRTHMRIANVKGRIDNAVSIGGWNVFPSQLEEVLFCFPESGTNFRCIVDSDEKGLDRLEVQLEVCEKSLLHDTYKQKDFCKRIQLKLQSACGVTAKNIIFVEPGSLPVATDDQMKTSTIRMVERRKMD